jgi:hypothetical protein
MTPYRGASKEPVSCRFIEMAGRKFCGFCRRAAAENAEIAWKFGKAPFAKMVIGGVWQHYILWRWRGRL